jgi:hypothetical protein
MGKGFFTQSACVLLSRPAVLDEVVSLLGETGIVKRTDDRPASDDMAGPSVVLAFRPEVNGYVDVDIQNRPWPDHMGDPKAEPMLLGAWSMGHFGPFTFPGNLQRAAEQSWGWKAGREIPERHRAFIRIRSTYVFGAQDETRLMPDDYDPLGELVFVTRVARRLLDHPAALAYFNPNGETLRERAALEDRDAASPPPLDVWTNVRLFNPGNGWLLMDTVGMSQLDRQDCEACFPEESNDPGEIDAFLRNVCLYLMEAGDVIKDGHTVDGPRGARWRARHIEEPLVSPPRPTLRLFPADAQPPPELER